MSSRIGRVATASAIGVFQRVGQLLSTLVTLPILLHELGVSTFGLWGAATSLAALAGIVDLGLGGALLTVLPRLMAVQDHASARRVVAAALAASFVVAVFILLLGLTVVFTLVPTAFTALAITVVICIAANVPLSLGGNLWFALQKGSRAALWDLFQTLLAVLTVMVTCALHAGLLASVVAIYGSMLVANSCCLAHVLLSNRPIRPVPFRTGPAEIVGIMGRGGMLFAITAAVAASYVFDTLLALYWIGPDASAQVTIALRICMTAVGLVVVATQSLWPAFVEALATRDRLWLVGTLKRATILVGLGAIIGAGIFLLLGRFALRVWFGAAFEPDDLMIAAIAAWIVVWCVPRVPGLLFNAASILRPQLLAFLSAAILGVALKYELGRWLGADGIILGTPISWLLLVWPTYAVVAHRFLLASERVVSDPSECR